MNGVNLDHYGDALMRNPDTWVWLVVAVLGVAACLRVIALFGADDWVSFAVMLVVCWLRWAASSMSDSPARSRVTSQMCGTGSLPRRVPSGWLVATGW